MKSNKIIVKFYSVRLSVFEKCYIVLDIENEIADMLWLPLSILDTFESKEVVVYGIYIIFNICFGIFPNYKHSLIVYYKHNVD